MDQKAELSRKLLIAWKEAYRRGIAYDLCDRIIEIRDVPDKLAGAIFSVYSAKTKPRLLSKRERQCLSLISYGWSNRQVAGFLGISIQTVKTHLKKVRAKLETKTLSETVATAWRMKEIL